MSTLRPRPDVAGGTCSRGELGQVSELKFVCAHMGNPAGLKVSGRGALMNGDLDDGVALRDALAAAALASLVPMRTVKDLYYLVVEVPTRDQLPDVGCACGTCTLGWGRRPPRLRQWNT